MIGQVISHYRVLEELGSGGMGHVYKAEDTKLGRLVALKFLPHDLVRDPVALKRFEREARAASALNHPNICTIYEVGDEGHPFIAMELLEGATLRHRIAGRACPVDEVLALSVQIVDALEAAHAKGIVHRDVKPDNVFVNDRNHVKLLDFGLAKAHPTLSPDTPTEAAIVSDPTLIATSPGLIQGTVAYMSPEQARGQPLDGRSDLFSLGIVLYEMATGARPFTGTTAAVTFDAILNRDPLPPAKLKPGLPQGLDHVILKLLEKNPDDRYQSAGALMSDLKSLQRDVTSAVLAATRTVRRPRGAAAFRRRAVWMAASAATLGLAVLVTFAVRQYVTGDPGRTSIAVLPFSNDGDPSAQYVIDGIAVGIMNTLSQLPELRVVPRATAFRFPADAPDLKRVGTALGVRTLLTGHVHQVADAVNVQVALVDVATQSQLWGEQFERSSNDLVDIQERISTAVADTLQLRLTPEDRRRLAKHPTDNPEAYKLYLQGHSLWDQWTEASINQSIEFYHQATLKDPVYALAYYGLANSYVALAYLSQPPTTTMPLAKDNVTTALKLDDTLTEAHYLRGIIDLYYDWDMASASREFKRALTLNPRSPDAHFASGNYLVVLNRLEDARPEIEKSVELDPFSNTWNEQLAVFYSGLGQVDRAEAQARKALTQDPTSFWLHFDLGMILGREGHHDEALKQFEQSAAMAGDNPYAAGYLGYGQAVAGRRDEASKTLARLDGLSRSRYVPSFARALVYAGLHDTERAFEMLYKAREERDCWLLWYFILDGAFDGLRTDPRYAELLKPLRASAQ